MNSVSQAWRQHERALRRFLRDRAGSNGEGDDLLQALFLRALRRKFCPLAGYNRLFL